jgi:hypothetical protein
MDGEGSSRLDREVGALLFPGRKGRKKEGGEENL